MTQQAHANTTTVRKIKPSHGEPTAATELGDQDIAALRSVLSGNALRLLRLPAGLELDFRADYRSKATEVVRSSVYGLVGLYLLVVLPIAFFVNAPLQDLWRHFAVYPIGLALLIIWLCTRFFRHYTEASLKFGAFLSLLGPIYAFMALGESTLGLVAGCETIYVLMVVFSMLMLRISDVLGCALAAFALATSAMFLSGHGINWVHVFLYFWVPLLICTVTGFLLEYVARRNYAQAMLHQQDRIRVVNYLAALISHVDNVSQFMSLALKRLCQHNGWPLGRVFVVAETDLAEPVTFARADLADVLSLRSQHLWCSPASSPFKEALAHGEPCWSDCRTSAVTQFAPTLRRHLIFPIKLDDRVLAVLEFYCEQKVLPDQHLFALMDNVCLQFGRVFEHASQKRALQYKAMHDALTGLPNRAYLFEHLSREMARTKRDTDSNFCVLFVDADHFKWVNDSMGHLAGDKLLVELANRLRRCVRTEDFVARLGGDEFAIVVHLTKDDQRINTTIECIRSRLLQPFVIEQQNILLGLSVGVVMYDSRYSEPEELLRDADTAMYSAKKKGRGRFEVFDLDMHAQVVERITLFSELRLALETEQFVLHYQPVVNTKSGQITTFEALIRWQHPQQGLLTPNRFIPLAEETGLIVQLTDWVLKQACQQLQVWQLQLGASDTSISVNLCTSYLALPDLSNRVMAIATEAKIDPRLLHLEITETQVAANAAVCMSNISQLRDMGFAIYIDDFGTGYSSLNYLANFRVNALKIDKSFSDRLCEDGKEAHIVQIIIELGHHLNLNVIAEGVETPEQLQRLQNMGCDFIQGYIYSRPVTAQQASDMLCRQVREGAGLFKEKVVG